MANDAPIAVEVRDRVASIRLNEPEKLNSLSPEMMLRIPQVLADVVQAGARAALISAAGRAFCTGARLGSRPEAEHDLGEVVERYYNPIARALAEAPIPIVSAINGPAAGAGVSLALGADIIVAARSSYLMLSFCSVGLVPDAGATWLIAQSAGRTKALEMALLGERMSAEEAYAVGLVTRVVDDADLLDAAWDLALRLAAKPTMALGLARKQVREALASSFDASLAIEQNNQRRAGYSADYAEGVAAFKEKRQPQFQGS